MNVSYLSAIKTFYYITHLTEYYSFNFRNFLCIEPNHRSMYIGIYTCSYYLVLIVSVFFETFVTIVLSFLPCTWTHQNDGFSNVLNGHLPVLDYFFDDFNVFFQNVFLNRIQTKPTVDRQVKDE